MAERHGNWDSHRTALDGRRCGVPLGRPYEWHGFPAEKLAAIRRQAAALCGLSDYPAELIRLSESLDEGWGRMEPAERKRIAKRYRRLALAAQREQAASEGSAA